MIYSKIILACYIALLFKTSYTMGLCFNMTLQPVREDVISTSDNIISFTTSSRVNCAQECAFNEKCLAFFINGVSKECSLFSLPTDNLTLISDEGWVGYDFEDPSRSFVHDEPLELWIESVSNFSSEYFTNGHTAIIGPSDVYPSHGDLPGAWAAKNWSHGPEWIMVKIAQLLFMIRIDLYETFNPGGTKEISAMKPDGNWDVVWTSNEMTAMTTSRINSIFINEPGFATDELLITIDGWEAQTWVEIDAVKVIGEPA